VTGDLDLEAIRSALLERRAVLGARLADLSKPAERTAELSFGKRIGDGTIEAGCRLTEIGVGANLEASEQRVERALAKLEEGTYGICDACGQPIAPRRLEALPESVLCVSCAAR
jgi:DnaK suppressor protein